ncbi:MAG: hypothetical protein Q7U20_07725 [Caulobacter sp.]|nr:hypothetical protein [Caulobacter sp.]
MSALYDKIKGGFAFMEAPFGVHPRDRERAVEYRKAAKEMGLTWRDAEEDVRRYCAEQGWNDVETQKQVERAKKLLQAQLG